MISRLLTCSILLITLLVLFTPLAAGQEDFPDLCSEMPGNLIRNCEFNNSMDNWNAFVEVGNPRVSVESGWPACDSPKCPALRLAADDWFVGGIYQQVPDVTPGVTYWANVIWLVYAPAGKIDGTVGRKIGIDPTGGTDPASPNIVWSDSIWNKFDSCPYKICRELQVRAVAQSTTITLFVRIEDTWKNRREEFSYVPGYFFEEPEYFWIDDVGMIAVDSPPAEAAVPTDTPEPPTQTSAPPTETPIPATATATDTPLPPSPSPTSTPTPTLTPSPTPTPTPTSTPTLTPVPATSTPRPTITATRPPEILIDPVVVASFGGLACLAGAGVLSLVTLAGLLYWLLRLGSGEEDADLDSTPENTEEEKIVVMLTDGDEEIGSAGESSQD